MKNTKALVLILCGVLLVTATVLGTLAYLISQDTVVNTFTVGDVSITLDETKVTPDGKPVGDLDGDGSPDRTNEGNDYHLIPGQTYIKDPTVTVKSGSEESYVRVLVTINKLAELDAIFAPTGADLLSIFNGYDDTKWDYVGKTEADNTITYEFRYAETVNAVDAAEDIVLSPLFTAITLPGEMTGAQLKTLYTDPDDRLSITVTAHAIQKSGFTTADAAWTAFEAQVAA